MAKRRKLVDPYGLDTELEGELVSPRRRLLSSRRFVQRMGSAKGCCEAQPVTCWYCSDADPYKVVDFSNAGWALDPNYIGNYSDSPANFPSGEITLPYSAAHTALFSASVCVYRTIFDSTAATGPDSCGGGQTEVFAYIGDPELGINNVLEVILLRKTYVSCGGATVLSDFGYWISPNMMPCNHSDSDVEHTLDTTDRGWTGNRIVIPTGNVTTWAP